LGTSAVLHDLSPLLNEQHLHRPGLATAETGTAGNFASPFSMQVRSLDLLLAGQEEFACAKRSPP
jgi:hypothetical protein